MKTDEELKEIAMGINAGTIFTDRHIPEDQSEMIGIIFIIISLMDEKMRKEWIASKPGMIYEYMSAAGPRTINGFPSFMSMHILTQEETKKVFDYMSKIKEAVEKL